MVASMSKHAEALQPATYDEIHVVHAPEGANVVRSKPTASRPRVIRRPPGEPPLSVGQIAEAVGTLDIPDGAIAPWSIRDRRITPATSPRCVKVIFVASPVEQVDWTELSRTYGALDDYFASYRCIVPRLEPMLPATWSWFTVRVCADARSGPTAAALHRRLRTVIASPPGITR